MSSWRRPMGSGDPGNLEPEVMREQQQAIERAAEEAKRRVEAEDTGNRSWWQRLRFWFRP